MELSGERVLCSQGVGRPDSIMQKVVIFPNLWQKASFEKYLGQSNCDKITDENTAHRDGTEVRPVKPVSDTRCKWR